MLDIITVEHEEVIQGLIYDDNFSIINSLKRLLNSNDENILINTLSIFETALNICSECYNEFIQVINPVLKKKFSK